MFCVRGCNWQDKSESSFRGLLTEQEGVVDVTRLVASDRRSPALVQVREW